MLPFVCPLVVRFQPVISFDESVEEVGGREILDSRLVLILVVGDPGGGISAQLKHLSDVVIEPIHQLLPTVEDPFCRIGSNLLPAFPPCDPPWCYCLEVEVATELQEPVDTGMVPIERINEGRHDIDYVNLVMKLRL